MLTSIYGQILYDNKEGHQNTLKMILLHGTVSNTMNKRNA